MDEETARGLDTANGEAMFAGLSMSALWAVLVANGTIPKDAAASVLDNTLLILERNQETRPGGGPGAIVHARNRLEALIGRIRAMPG